MTFWSEKELLAFVNSEKRVMGFISYANNFADCVDEDDANHLWEDS